MKTTTKIGPTAASGNATDVPQSAASGCSNGFRGGIVRARIDAIEERIESCRGRAAPQIPSGLRDKAPRPDPIASVADPIASLWSYFSKGGTATPSPELKQVEEPEERGKKSKALLSGDEGSGVTRFDAHLTEVEINCETLSPKKLHKMQEEARALRLEEESRALNALSEPERNEFQQSRDQFYKAVEASLTQAIQLAADNEARDRSWVEAVERLKVIADPRGALFGLKAEICELEGEIERLNEEAKLEEIQELRLVINRHVVVLSDRVFSTLKYLENMPDQLSKAAHQQLLDDAVKHLREVLAESDEALRTARVGDAGVVSAGLGEADEAQQDAIEGAQTPGGARAKSTDRSLGKFVDDLVAESRKKFETNDELGSRPLDIGTLRSDFNALHRKVGSATSIETILQELLKATIVEKFKGNEPNEMLDELLSRIDRELSLGPLRKLPEKLGVPFSVLLVTANVELFEQVAGAFSTQWTRLRNTPSAEERKLPEMEDLKATLAAFRGTVESIFWKGDTQVIESRATSLDPAARYVLTEIVGHLAKRATDNCEYGFVVECLLDQLEALDTEVAEAIDAYGEGAEAGPGAEGADDEFAAPQLPGALIRHE